MKPHLLTEDRALKLLIDSGCSKKVILHCEAVADLAVEVAKKCKEKGLQVNIDLVRIGALLHDIGRSETHSVDHSIIGAQIARTLKLPVAIISIIERHVGSGITESSAKMLGWPAKSYIPQSLEERIVAYTDKLIEGSKRVSFEVAVKRFRSDSNIKQDSIERLKSWHKFFSECLN